MLTEQTRHSSLTRWRAGAVHLALSIFLVGAAALWARFVWYPGPFFEVSGAAGLLGILFPVDLVLGPLLTTLIFNPFKPWRLIRIDLTIIGMVQITALAYGLWMTAEVRPAYVALYGSQLVVVRSTDIAPSKPWMGPMNGPEWVFVPSTHAEDPELSTFISVLAGHAAPVFDTASYEKLSSHLPRFRAVLRPAAEISASQLASNVNKVAVDHQMPLSSLAVVPIRVVDESMTALLNIYTLDLLAIFPEPIPNPPA